MTTLDRLKEERDRVSKELLAMRKLPLAQRDENAYEAASARLGVLTQEIGNANEQEAEPAEKEKTMSKKKEAAKKPATKTAKAAPKPAQKRDVAPQGATAAKGKGKPAPTPKGAPRATDPRLPTPGTVLQKTDRHGKVRCECTVEADGVRYGGTLFRSISSAALAAARDLGLKNKTQNGYVFWGIVKLGGATNHLASVEASWQRYCQRVARLIKEGVTDENRNEVAGALGKHLKAIEDFTKGAERAASK